MKKELVPVLLVLLVATIAFVSFGVYDLDSVTGQAFNIRDVGPLRSSCSYLPLTVEYDPYTSFSNAVNSQGQQIPAYDSLTSVPSVLFSSSGSVFHLDETTLADAIWITPHISNFTVEAGMSSLDLFYRSVNGDIVLYGHSLQYAGGVGDRTLFKINHGRTTSTLKLLGFTPYADGDGGFLGFQLVTSGTNSPASYLSEVDGFRLFFRGTTTRLLGLGNNFRLADGLEVVRGTDKRMGSQESDEVNGYGVKVKSPKRNSERDAVRFEIPNRYCAR